MSEDLQTQNYVVKTIYLPFFFIQILKEKTTQYGPFHTAAAVLTCSHVAEEWRMSIVFGVQNTARVRLGIGRWREEWSSWQKRVEKVLVYGNTSGSKNLTRNSGTKYAKFATRQYPYLLATQQTYSTISYKSTKSLMTNWKFKKFKKTNRQCHNQQDAYSVIDHSPTVECDSLADKFGQAQDKDSLWILFRKRYELY